MREKMPTYYEILKIEPSASSNEIEAAIDSQYNNFRRLVTHHDQNIVAQANQALALLEQMRATLLDSSKRGIYDAAIGVNAQQLGGLADPSALFQMAAASAPPMTPPMPKLAEAHAVIPAAGFVDAWVCPKCSTPNSKGSQFCSKCGAQVGYDCPKCKTKIHIQSIHCPNCGVNIKTELKRGRDEKSIRLQHIENTITDLNQQVNNIRQQNVSTNEISSDFIIGIVGAIILIFLIIFEAPEALSFFWLLAIVLIVAVIKYRKTEKAEEKNSMVDNTVNKLLSEIEKLKMETCHSLIFRRNN